MTADNSPVAYFHSQQEQYKATLAQLADKEVAEIQAMLYGVEREILHRFDRMTDFSKGRAITLLEEVRTWMGPVKERVADRVAQAAGNVAAGSTDFHGKMLSFGGKAENVSIIRRTQEQMTAFFHSTPVGGELLKDWVNKTFDGPLVDKIKHEIGVGLFQGESYQALANRLKQGFGMTKVQIDTLVRTYVASANVAGMKAAYEANKDIIQGVRWSSSKDRRTCLVCLVLDSKEFSLEAHPPCPSHMRCRCVLTPVADYSAIGLRPEDIPQRPPDLSMPLSQWARSLKPGDQRQLFGPKRYDLLQAGIVTVDDLVDMNTYKVKPLAQLLEGSNVQATLEAARSHNATVAAGAAGLAAAGAKPTQAQLEIRLEEEVAHYLQLYRMGAMRPRDRRRLLKGINDIERKLGRKPSTRWTLEGRA